MRVGAVIVLLFCGDYGDRHPKRFNVLADAGWEPSRNNAPRRFQLKLKEQFKPYSLLVLFFWNVK